MTTTKKKKVELDHRRAASYPARRGAVPFMDILVHENDTNAEHNVHSQDPRANAESRSMLVSSTTGPNSVKSHGWHSTHPPSPPSPPRHPHHKHVFQALPRRVTIVRPAPTTTTILSKTEEEKDRSMIGQYETTGGQRRLASPRSFPWLSRETLMSKRFWKKPATTTEATTAITTALPMEVESHLSSSSLRHALDQEDLTLKQGMPVTASPPPISMPLESHLMGGVQGTNMHRAIDKRERRQGREISVAADKSLPSRASSGTGIDATRLGYIYIYR
jgi:hypothetical protein